jgi:SAM-dependent methyltransferase
MVNGVGTVRRIEVSTVRDYYDRYWSAARQDFALPPGLERALRTNVEPGLTWLDVGCGAGGTYAQVIAPGASRYVGVDVSEEAADLARKAGIEAQAISDATALPFKDETFDAAICVEVFEHLFAPHDAAAEIRRVLRPGGRLIASVPNVSYWRMRLNSMSGVWNPAGDWLSVEQPWRDPHVRFFTIPALERMLRGAGFSISEIGASGGCLLDHATTRPTSFGTSAAYRALERRFPSLLGMTVHAVARR